MIKFFSMLGLVLSLSFISPALAQACVPSHPDCAPSDPRPAPRPEPREPDNDRRRGKPCVTKAEFGRIVDGMHVRRVHRIFDGRGRLISGGTSMDRGYRVCRSWGNPRRSSVEIWYDTYTSDKPGYRVWGKYSRIVPRRR